MIRKAIPAAVLATLLAAPVAADPAMAPGKPRPNQFWLPDQLNLQPLRDHDPASSPYGATPRPSPALTSRPSRRTSRN